MAKIAVSIPDSTLKKIDTESNTDGVTRSKYVAMALEFYLNGANNYKTEISNFKEELAAKTKELESLSNEVLPLKETVHTLENKLEQSDRAANSKANEVFQKEKKIHTLENQIAEKDKRIESLSKEVLKEKDEGMKIRVELEQAKIEAAKYESALKVQQSDVEFLRGHVSQLTQSVSQLSLKPGEEEIKKKGWWQFWK